MLTAEEATQRVARGAAHLDRVKPGWFNDVDTGTLTLASCTRCVLGQLYGSESEADAHGYWKAIDSFGWNPFDQADEPPFVAEGFSLSAVSVMGEDRKSEWRPLQDAWIAAIADRKIERARQPAPAHAEAVNAVRLSTDQPVMAIRA